ncbi:GNAT family N-acetyltransferase [Paenibacillus sp. 1011MAR3C5]|uniref:GNAT family N-acetyltransferase n=1 Tax=Paenibacillus sp. 1011MAR3C5 TaxID=1675787 RepID=UPI000E6B6795|nr:GNAT family N-acetyltransferase [Paenibacillus sp. 1011MAR3C5]RJE85212.1 GNAT family N-acetyltransferase [Paenibacillus sp. 1011MAR3C5]
MQYTVRMASTHDIDGLCTIRNNKDLFTSYLTDQENKAAILIVAEMNTIILGFGVLRLRGKLVPKLSDLYVKEAYRGKGIGSELINYRERLARDLGYTEMYVSVDPIENPKMIKLISKYGYHAISEPYSKDAIYFNEDGSSYEKTYTRIDLKKLLN